MDIVLWIILIVAAVAVVWWLLNRNSSSTARPTQEDAPPAHANGALSGGGAAPSAEAAATTGIPGAAGFGAPAEPVAPAAAEEPADAATGSGRPAGEWETQWSEGSASGTPEVTTPASPSGVAAAPDTGGTPAGAPVHHAEYTDRHAPTLPGAESAAVEEDVRGDGGHSRADHQDAVHNDAGEQVAGEVPDGAAAAETMDRTESSALVETGADRLQDQHAAPAEPAGHLAAGEPYGAGSAAAGADGTGPSGYPVKGLAADMVYYDEDHPGYAEARAEVWFESAAHAEAAGFRAPRRQRL